MKNYNYKNNVYALSDNERRHDYYYTCSNREIEYSDIRTLSNDVYDNARESFFNDRYADDEYSEFKSYIYE